MAIFNAFSSVSMPDLTVWVGDLIANNSTTIVIDDGFRRTTYTGSFTYPGGGLSGTVNSITEARGGVDIYTISGMNTSAVALYDAVQIQGDFLAAAELVGESHDTFNGSSGNDELRSFDGNDIVYGLAGNDRIIGGRGSDSLFGGDGADYLGGGAGADDMYGGLGNDFYIVDNAGDSIAGEIGYSAGGGIDTVRSFIDYVQPTNIELVRLGNINDTTNLNATGNGAPGTLVGNAGDNRLSGGYGNDQVNGNDGDDTLEGGNGRDTVVGGAGEDTFVYNLFSDSRAGAANRDVVNGFTRGAVQDRIDLSGIDADISTAANDAFTFIGSTGFSGTAGELRTQNLGGPNAILVEADIDGDRVADMQIFVNLTTFMNETDFIL